MDRKIARELIDLHLLNGQTEGLARHDIQPFVVEKIAQIVRDVAAEHNYPLIDIYKVGEKTMNRMAGIVLILVSIVSLLQG